MQWIPAEENDEARQHYHYQQQQHERNHQWFNYQHVVEGRRQQKEHRRQTQQQYYQQQQLQQQQRIDWSSRSFFQEGGVGVKNKYTNMLVQNAKKILIDVDEFVDGDGGTLKFRVEADLPGVDEESLIFYFEEEEEEEEEGRVVILKLGVKPKRKEENALLFKNLAKKSIRYERGKHRTYDTRRLKVPKDFLLTEKTHKDGVAKFRLQSFKKRRRVIMETTTLMRRCIGRTSDHGLRVAEVRQKNTHAFYKKLLIRR